MTKLLALAILAVSEIALFAVSSFAVAPLPRSTPEAQGVSSAGVLAFIDAADKQLHSLNSFMLIRHGHVVAEGWWAPYRPDAPHSLYSLSKSFTSTAVGLAISEGKLSLDDEVLKFFPDEAPQHPSKNLKSMRVRDLLRMECGQQVEVTRNDDESWAKQFLAQPVPFKPGTHFLYNTTGTYMLSAIVQKATGQTLLDYLTPRLFDPLGIENPTWTMSPQGVCAGGFGLSIRTEDIARFGQLYLQKGKWDGKQIVPEAWVTAATTLQTSNGSNPKSDWDQGYCYQFWRCRHGAYRGDGMWGQYCIVMPEQDAVVAITSGLDEMQPPLDLIWDKLLPAMKDAPLEADAVAQGKLAARLKNLEIPPQIGSATGRHAPGMTYEFGENSLKLESIRFEADKNSAAGGGGDKANAVTIIARVNGQDHEVVCPNGAWHDGYAAWGRLHHQPAAASGAWTADDTYMLKLCFYQTPFIVNVKFKFTGDEVQISGEPNLGRDETQPRPLVGKVKAAGKNE